MRRIPVLLILLLLLLTEASVAGAQPRLVAGPGGFDWNHVAGLPPEEAIALALQPENEPVRQGILSLVFRMWARQDPVAAYWRLSSLGDELDVSLFEPQIVEAWLAVDPPAAMAAALDSDHPQTLHMALRRYGDLDPVAALDFARDHAGRLTQADRIGLLESIASRHLDLAAAHVASTGDAELIDTFFIGFARRDPATAIDWLRTHFPEETDPYEGMGTVFYVADPTAAFAYLASMPASAARDAFRVSLCQAEEVNAASRAASGLPQGVYDISVCQR